jgi:tRNA (mo5U34)-methyltransferase
MTLKRPTSPLGIKRRVAKLGPWFHNIELDGVQTNPARPDYPMSRWRLLEPYVPEDLTGKTVLDLSCNSGFFSIMMKQRGAKYVLGIDVPPIIEQAKLVTEVLDVDIDLRAQNVYSFVLTNEVKFDYVLFLGLFYHLRHPLLVLDRVAELTKERMFFQTQIRGRTPVEGSLEGLSDRLIFDHPDFPRLSFIEGSYGGDRGTNWFFPNESGILAMLRSAGFRNIVNITSSGDRCFVADPPKALPWEDFHVRLARCPTFLPRPDADWSGHRQPPAREG